ncbi:MAG: hypothetical protein IT580_01260 [Verrucomicrobiales bacterium]|nr:hypothetical protein [Verrucomicrobiales bacterium]
MRIFAALLFLGSMVWTSAQAAARPGTVRVVTGDTVQGLVTAATNGLAVSPASGEPKIIPWAQLMEATFGDATPPAASITAPATPATATAAPTEVGGWNGVPVGTTLAGKLEEAPEHLLVTGQGRGLMGNADACFLAERKLDGSGQVSASLESFDGQAPEAAAGIMLRDNLGEAAAYAFLGQRVGSGVCFQYRQIASGMTMRVTNVAMQLPAWLRLSRVGGAILAEVSTDGLQWSQVGRVNVNLGQNVRAVLAVASGSDEAAATARFRKPAVGARGLGYVASTGYPRLRLRGGSTLVGPVESADDSVVRLGGPWKGTMVSLLNVARLEFAPLSPDHEARLADERVGVMLADGDFLDGRLRGIATNTATLSSLLFGFRKFALGSEAAVVVVGSPEEDDTRFQVLMKNGSELRARDLGTSGETLLVEAPLLGALRVDWNEVSRIQRFAEPR